jgi:hypothetical protein
MYNGEFTNQDDIKHFVVYMQRRPEPAGGNDKHNDCLYNCHLKAVGGDPKALPTVINTPAKLKAALGLNRDDPISIEHLQEYARIANVSFEVSGDYEYVTPKKPVHLKLYLLAEHFTLEKTKMKWVKGIYFEPIPKENIYVYKIIPQDKKAQTEKRWEVYDGKKTKSITFKEFAKYHDFKERLILIHAKKDADMKDMRDKYIELADKLREHTKGKINLYKYTKLHTAAFDLWTNHFATGIQEPEPLGALESSWIAKANKGGAHYAKPYEGPGYSYDMNVMYSHKMCDSNFKIPFKRGEFMTLPEILDKKEIKYGIYRCKVEGEHPLITTYRTHYTHMDLSLMLDFGLTVKLIQDGQANALIYDQERLSGKYMFSSFINYMTKLKDYLKSTTRK